MIEPPNNGGEETAPAQEGNVKSEIDSGGGGRGEKHEPRLTAKSLPGRIQKLQQSASNIAMTLQSSGLRSDDLADAKTRLAYLDDAEALADALRSDVKRIMVVIAHMKVKLAKDMKNNMAAVAAREEEN